MFSKMNVIMAYLGGDFLSFAISTNLTWSASVIPKLMNSLTSPLEKGLTVKEVSWVSSILMIGAALGVYVFIAISDQIGRRLALLLAGTLAIFCHLILAFATSLALFYTARFFIGLSVGGIYFLMPLYAGELMYENCKSILGPSIGIAACFGFLFSNSVGPFLNVKYFSLVLALLTALSVIFFYKFGEEVPHHYIKHNQELLARKALEKLRGGYEDIDDAFTVIQSRFLEEQNGKLKDVLLSKALIKAFFIGFVLLTVQQLSGAIVILFYGQTLFQKITSNLSPVISVLIISCLHFLSSGLPSVLGSKYGKTPLLFVSAIGMAISDIVLGIYVYCESKFKLPAFSTVLPLVCLITFIIFYNVGFSIYPFIILGEIFPIKVKSLVTSLIGACYWIIGFFFLKYFIQTIDLLGLHGYLAFSSLVCIGGAFFTRFYVIETRGKSFEEIQRELSALTLF